MQVLFKYILRSNWLLHFSGSGCGWSMLFKQPKANPGIAGSVLWSFKQLSVELAWNGMKLD